ncbi:hypothetical protein [Listeria monocytogenes]|uniref:hypothetical protein n=1 Tax=Listeria monocytogenes TaxID=1639 RepID=UPI003B43672C
MYSELKEHFQGEEIHLIHSQFIKRDRSAKEKAIFKEAKKKTKNVFGATSRRAQIYYSRSYQRKGCFNRQATNRALDVDTNVYVFDGGAKVCSGIGTFIDKLIFVNSKTILNEHAFDRKKDRTSIHKRKIITFD